MPHDSHRQNTDEARFSLEAHGIRLCASASTPDSTPIIDRLKEDFTFFLSANKTSSGVLEVQVALKDWEPPRIGPRLFATRMCSVYGWGSERLCDYGNGTWVHARNSSTQRRFEITSPDPNLLYEVAYTLILSVLGESLDLKGFHRVHALGFELGGKTGLLLLPMGAGKSASAALLLQRTNAKIYSDENPLIHRGYIYPYPLRIALRPEVAQAIAPDWSGRVFRRKIFPEKILFNIPPDRIASPAPVDLVLIGEKSESPPMITPISRLSASRRLMGDLVIGLGLAQMAEHMLRADAVDKLARITLSRAREARVLAKTSQLYRFSVSSDAGANVSALLDFLEKIPRKTPSP